MAKDLTLKTPDGQTELYPKTVADLVYDNTTGKTQKQMNDASSNPEYNVSLLYPTGGTSGTNIYTLAGAIGVLGSALTSAEKVRGVKVIFYDSANSIKSYYFTGSSYSNFGTESYWTPTPDFLNANGIGGAYDISAAHNNATYADLAAALGTNGANVPEGIRKGGMSVKFVQTSDNNYVQFRYMGTATTGTPNPFLDIANWQGVDKEPVKDSQNLITSGAVYDKTKDIETIELTESATPSVEIKKDNDDTVVKVTDNGVEVTGSLKLNTKNVATSDDLTSLHTAIEGELDDKQDVIEQISVTLGAVGEEDKIILADDNDNEVASISIGSPAIEEESQVWTNNDGTDEYARVSSKGVTAKQFYKQNGDIVGKDAYTITVDPNGHGDYTNIVDALNNAGDTPTKHVTIIINQGTYDMPPKVSSVAPYEESNRNLTLKGVNRNKCILQCNIGFYDYTIGTDCATLRLTGNVTIENLTIISSNDEYDNKIGTDGYITQRTDRKAAYCIHLDQNRQEGDVIVVRNCTLINYQMACIGFGTRKNSIIRVEDCYAQCEQAAQDSEANNYGTIWGHSGANAPGQRLEVLRCQLVHKTGNKAIRYSYHEVEGSNNVECSACLIGNAIKTQDVENALVINGFPEGTFTLDTLSFGNKCSAMNA